MERESSAGFEYRQGVEPLVQRIVAAAYTDLGCGHAVLSDEVTDGLTTDYIRGARADDFFAFDLALVSEHLARGRVVPQGFRARRTAGGASWFWAEAPWRSTPWEVGGV